jgi:hypothetical protein
MEQVYAIVDNSDAVEDYEIQKEAEYAIAFAANRPDPDTLYYNQAMTRASNAAKLKVAIVKEAMVTFRWHWKKTKTFSQWFRPSSGSA